jgi:hypothetical protein
LDQLSVWRRPCTMSVRPTTMSQEPVIEQGPPNVARRAGLSTTTGGIAGMMLLKSANAKAATTDMAFDQWIATFRTKAEARGITAETYTRVMCTVHSDMDAIEATRIHLSLAVRREECLREKDGSDCQISGLTYGRDVRRGPWILAGRAKDAFFGSADAYTRLTRTLNTQKRKCCRNAISVDRGHLLPSAGAAKLQLRQEARN